MNFESQIVCCNLITYLLECLSKQLKSKQIDKLFPQFNTNFSTELLKEMTFVCYQSKPINNDKFKYEEQQLPRPPKMQALINFQMPFEKLNETQSQQMQASCLKSSRSDIISHKDSSKESRKTYQSQIHAFPLSQPQITEQQKNQDLQIESIKSHLYFSRRIRRQNQLENKKRLQQILNRKASPKPKKQFTFDFDGSLIFKKQLFKSSNPITSIIGCEEIEQKKKLKLKRMKKVLDQKDEQSERDNLQSRNLSTSRLKKRSLFNNGNQRQSSHLPYLKLSEFSKVTQGHRTSFGPDSSNFTLKSFTSKGQSAFKHYSQIAKEKKDRQYSLKRSSLISQFSQDNEQETKLITTKTQIKRHSKRMEKYLLKIREDRTKDIVSQINKSCNFNVQRTPCELPVHRYYKHNFDEDKKNICELSFSQLSGIRVNSTSTNLN